MKQAAVTRLADFTPRSRDISSPNLATTCPSTKILQRRLWKTRWRTQQVCQLKWLPRGERCMRMRARCVSVTPRLLTYLSTFWPIQKISQWYRHQLKEMSRPKGIQGIIRKIVNSMFKLSACPRKQSAVNLYSTLYFKDHMKSDFDKQWNSVKDTVPHHARLPMCKAYVQARWEAEPLEFCEALEKQTQATFETDTMAYKATADNQRLQHTSQEYHS